MTTFEWFLYFWFGMALIKLTLTVFAALSVIFEYEKIEGGLGIVSSALSVIVMVLGIAVVIIMIWPFNLYSEKSDYFKLPKKEMNDFYLKYIRNFNK